MANMTKPSLAEVAPVGEGRGGRALGAADGK